MHPPENRGRFRLSLGVQGVLLGDPTEIKNVIHYSCRARCSLAIGLYRSCRRWTDSPPFGHRTGSLNLQLYHGTPRGTLVGEPARLFWRSRCDAIL